MYGIYANIGGILMVNVTIYTVHGSYGVYIMKYTLECTWFSHRNQREAPDPLSTRRGGGVGGRGGTQASRGEPWRHGAACVWSCKNRFFVTLTVQIWVYHYTTISENICFLIYIVALLNYIVFLMIFIYVLALNKDKHIHAHAGKPTAKVLDNHLRVRT